MEDALKHGAKKLGDAILTFGKNYLSCAVVNGLKPVIINAVTELLEDTKKEVGMKVEVKEDKLGDGKGSEQSDLFGMQLDSIRSIQTGWSYTFTAYTLYCIRVGFNPKGEFFALGAKYEVRYNILSNMFDKFKHEFKDSKAVLPKDCLHGTYCCCLEHKPDMAGTEQAMKEFLHNLAKEHPTSKSVPSFFYLGDNYKQQQRQYAVFTAAFDATKAQLIKGEFNSPLEPFNEGEALTQLLQGVARTEVVPEVRANVFKIPGGFCEWRAYYYADMAVLSAIDSAMSVGWPQAQDAVNKGTIKVQEAIDAGAAKLVEELKPVLKKVLELVQSKLKKKDDGKEDHKEEESKKNKTEIGDYISQWRFDQTAIGKKFWDGLDSKDAKEALEKLSGEFDKAVEETLEEKMKAGLSKILGDKTANLEIVALILEHIAKQAVGTLKKFTTIKPLMSASLGMFNVRAELEKELHAGKADQKAVQAAIEKASAEMWKTFPDAGLLLFSQMDKLKDSVKAEFGHLSQPAILPLLQIADQLYAEQMKALNSLRTQFAVGLKTKLEGDALKSDESISAIVRGSFRDIVFSIVHILVVDSWKGISSNLIASAIVQVKEKFTADVWPTIASGLDAIQALIPAPVADMGLQIEPLAQSVAFILLEKGVNWALTKFIIKLELVLFEQANTVLNM